MMQRNTVNTFCIKERTSLLREVREATLLEILQLDFESLVNILFGTVFHWQVSEVFSISNFLLCQH